MRHLFYLENVTAERIQLQSTVCTFICEAQNYNSVCHGQRTCHVVQPNLNLHCLLRNFCSSAQEFLRKCSGISAQVLRNFSSSVLYI